MLSLSGRSRLNGVNNNGWNRELSKGFTGWLHLSWAWKKKPEFVRQRRKRRKMLELKLVKLPTILCVLLCLLPRGKYLFFFFFFSFSLAKYLLVKVCSQGICLESPGVLVKMQSLRLHPRGAEIELVGLEYRHLCL